MYVCTHVSTHALEVQKTALNPTEVKLQAAASQSTWVLGAGLVSFVVTQSYSHLRRGNLY